MTGPSRRAVLAAAGAVGVSVVLAGCGDERSGKVGGVPSEPERITYGDDPSQWVDLHVPEGASRGLVIVLHGGFWKAQYGADYGAPLAEDLVARGWTAANVEYRRVGNGGGFPATLDDVHAAIGAVAADASGPVGYPISDFYMTNAVCRASPTMQRCSAEITHGQDFAEAAE